MAGLSSTSWSKKPFEGLEVEAAAADYALHGANTLDLALALLQCCKEAASAYRVCHEESKAEEGKTKEDLRNGIATYSVISPKKRASEKGLRSSGQPGCRPGQPAQRSAQPGSPVWTFWRFSFSKRQH